MGSPRANQSTKPPPLLMPLYTDIAIWDQITAYQSKNMIKSYIKAPG